MNDSEETADGIERNLGTQPIAAKMAERGLKAADLVKATPGCITFKMVTRACKGRRLTQNTQQKVLTAFNRAAGTNLAACDLFTYEA
jgi:hypothetical protein